MYTDGVSDSTSCESSLTDGKDHIRQYSRGRTIDNLGALAPYFGDINLLQTILTSTTK